MPLNFSEINNNYNNKSIFPPPFKEPKDAPFNIFKTRDTFFQNFNAGLALETPENEEVEVVAHRGYTDDAPENTIPAFEAAAKAGYDTVECDIEWTKDSVPVLLHDNTINRTARHKNGWPILFKKKCSSLNYKDLSKYDFGISKGKEFKGTKIPTFEQFSDCCSDNNLKAYVELKESSKFDKEKAKKLVEIVKETGLEDKVTWTSFNADYLKMMKELMPNARLGYLSKEKPTAETVKILESLKTATNDVFLDVKENAIDKQSSQMLENSGFDFEAWNVNTNDQLENLKKLDCKGVTTDTLLESDVDKIF